MRTKAMLLACLVGLAGCGGSGVQTASTASRSYLGTQAPGDVWSWQLTATTFSATNQTQNTHYSGTKATLPTGFLKLTIGSTDDPNVAAGSSAYALEFPGTALLVKPAGADTKPPIVAGSLGGNPAGPNVSFNFVAVPGAAFDQTTSQAYGHVAFAVTNNTYSGTSKRFAIDGTALPDGPSNFVGNNGLMTDTDGMNGVNATGAMTPTGVCVLDYGPNAGGVIGVIQPAANVNLSEMTSRSFRGYLINQGKTQCVTVTPNGDGTLHGAGYANPSGVETGTFDNGSGVTVSFTGQPNPGELTTTITTTGSTETLVVAVNLVNGKYMLFGFGVGSDGKGYNVVLVEN
jgi:hypothetical protein